MKNVKKLVVSLLVIGTIVSLGAQVQASAAWKKDNTGWWYTEGDNSYAKGWRKIDGKSYYFNDKGYMISNTYVNGYYLGKDGAWIEKLADPNKKLSGGVTLGEAKSMIDTLIATIKSRGDTVENNMRLIQSRCNELGTTYEEISRLPEIVVQPQTAPNVVQQAPAESSGVASDDPFSEENIHGAAGGTGGKQDPEFMRMINEENW